MYGTETYQGSQYALAEAPTLTNRVFPGWWGDATAGEDYTAEYSARAIDRDGSLCRIYWQFAAVRDAEPDDESEYPFDSGHVSRVERL